MNSLLDIHERLCREWLAFETQWRSTRRKWNDRVADRFEKEYWHEIEEDMPPFLRELQHVNDTLDQALRTLT